MAYKVFTNGSVLQASEINENLMQQSIAVFSNAAARSAAITSPVEGQVTYLEDTNSLQLFNGTTWGSAIPVSSGNIIINGAFEINQRNYVSGSNLASGVYGFDRWKSNFTNTTLTFTSAPQGQEISINSGGGLQQVIEQANIPAGSYTLSWSGTSTGRVYNSGATPPSYAASPITVTLDGSANVVVEFTASGASRTLSKVQFESGASATPFRRNSDSREGELAACQRFYQRITSGAAGFGIFAAGLQNSTTASIIFWNAPVTFRAPAISADWANVNLEGGNYNQIISTLAVSGSNSQLVLLSITHSAVGAVNSPVYLRATGGFAGFVGISAEL